MLPKLSQKAWNKIQRRVKYECDYDDIDGVMLDTMDSFMSLFDLEKYPITNDMLFGYIINQHRHFYIDLLLEVKSKSTPMNFSFGGTRKRDQSVCSWYRVVDNIRTLAFNHHSNEIIIIGEIHGWWEKGETQ